MRGRRSVRVRVGGRKGERAREDTWPLSPEAPGYALRGPPSWAELAWWPSSRAPEPAAEGTHWLHRSCKFQETPCQPSVVGEGWRLIHAGSLALGEQMCLPRGQPPKKSSNQSMFAHYKRVVCEGALEGRLFWGGGEGGFCHRSLPGAHRCHCILLEGRREGAKPARSVGAAGSSFLHFTASSQTQLLAAPERGQAK